MKHNQTSCYLQPPFLGTPLVPSRHTSTPTRPRAHAPTRPTCQRDNVPARPRARKPVSLRTDRPTNQPIAFTADASRFCSTKQPTNSCFVGPTNRPIIKSRRHRPIVESRHPSPDPSPARKRRIAKGERTKGYLQVDKLKEKRQIKRILIKMSLLRSRTGTEPGAGPICYLYVYIYIYRERERERKRDR